jgi:hypothetical protein
LIQKKERKKKIKANPIAPRVLPCLRLPLYKHRSLILATCVLKLLKQKKTDCLSDQGSTAEETTLKKFNQGERKKRAVYRFFLDFLVLLCQDKRT